MFSRLLPISLLIFSLSSLEAHANEVCHLITECQNVIKQAQTRIQELSSTDRQIVSSRTGAVFTRDVSVPALEEAYRDPSGLIWGSIVLTEGKVKMMSQYDAYKYCKDLGVRLPNKEEFKQLSKYLGEDSNQRYSPYLVDGDERIDFLSNTFWSSSTNTNGSNSGYAFKGLVAHIFLSYNGYHAAVRCVAGH